jgi:hypothetical protein
MTATAPLRQRLQLAQEAIQKEAYGLALGHIVWCQDELDQLCVLENDDWLPCATCKRPVVPRRPRYELIDPSCDECNDLLCSRCTITRFIGSGNRKLELKICPRCAEPEEGSDDAA